MKTTLFLNRFSALRRGRKALPVAQWNFEHLLNEPTKSLRKLIFRRPTKNMPLAI